MSCYSTIIRCRIRQNLFTDERDEAVQAIFKQLDLEHLALERQIDLDGLTLSGGEISV